MPTLGEVTLGECEVSGMLASPSTLRARCSRSDRACVINRASKPHVLVAVNSHWSRLCGYGPTEAVGKSPSELLHGSCTDHTKAGTFAETLRQHGSATVTLINYTKLGRPFVHRIRSERVTENGTDYYLTESYEEEDASIAEAVLSKAGLPTAVRSELGNFGRAWSVALVLIALLFSLANSYAASAIKLKEATTLSYDGYVIQDPYFFSVFDHGLPLVG